MTEKVTFKFFEGRDVDQFTFYRIPKQLFTVSHFKGVSCEAKVLYGLMLDRISLSVKNHWFDENNRAYIYFTIDDVMELLGCGKNKAIKCLKELDVETGIGLTQKRRQGFGKSNMIYVKTFLVESQAEAIADDPVKAAKDISYDLVKEIEEEGISIDTSAICIYTGEESQADNDSIPEYADEEFFRENYASAGSVRDKNAGGSDEAEGSSVGDTVESFLGVEKQTSAETDEIPGNRQGQTSVEANEAPQNVPEQTSLQEPEGLGTDKRRGEKGISTIAMPVNDMNLGKNGHIYPEITWDSDYSGSFTRPAGPAEKFDNQTNGEMCPDTEVYFSNNKKFKKQISRSPENKLQEVYISNPNKTKYKKTEYSYNKSYRIVSGDGDSLPIAPGMDDAMRYDGKQTDSGTGLRAGTGHETGTIYALVRNNIDLDGLLVARQADHDLILEIYSLIVEMVSCRSKEVVIASSRYPADLVRSRFLKLDYDHINYVIDCLDKNTTKVKNIRKYLLASLFNAPATIDGYYRAEVRHDMPGIVQGAFSCEGMDLTRPVID